MDEVTPPPAALIKAFGLSPLYVRYLSAGGLPVLGSGKVPDAALCEAAYIVSHLLTGRDDVRRALIEIRVRVAVMASSENTTDIPEHSDLTPKAYWDARARGLGATPARPAVSCAEENLLHLAGDRYSRESILVHEFAHTIHEMGLNRLDKNFDAQLRAAYRSAMSRGLWKQTYAATNEKEYWAEGVQSYFDANAANDSQHNHVSTREVLAGYDPDLFRLTDTAFRRSAWRYKRRAARRPAGAL